MLIRKNISLDEKYLKKLQPLLDENGGNLSAAIRDTIELTDIALQNHENIKQSIDFLNIPQYSSTEFDDLFENGENIIINHMALKWLLKNSCGCLIDEKLVDELINPFSIRTMVELGAYLNNISQKFRWGIEISISYMDPNDPDIATIMFSNGDSYLRDFLAEHVALFITKWKQLDIDGLYRRSKSIRINFKKASFASGEVPSGIKKHFGFYNTVHEEFNDKPEFWNKLATAYKITDYNMVAFPRNLFEDIVAGNVPDVVGIFETMINQPIMDIPLSELLVMIKKIFLVSQVVNNIEIDVEPGHEYVKIRHSYRNEKTISKIIQYFMNIFEANGKEFDVTYSNSLIIFKHRVQGSK